MQVHPEQRALQYRATGVVEIHVDPVWRGGPQLGSEVGVSMAHGRIQLELVDQPAAFLVGTGDADHSTPADLRQLGGDVPDRSGRRGHQDRLAGPRLADLEQAEVGREPIGAEGAQLAGTGSSVRGEHGQSRRWVNRVLLPAGGCADQGAGRHRRVGGRLDPGDPVPVHHPARDRRPGVAGAALQPGALPRSDGDGQRSTQDLARFRFRPLGDSNLEVALRQRSLWQGSDHHLPVVGHGGNLAGRQGRR